MKIANWFVLGTALPAVMPRHPQTEMAGKPKNILPFLLLTTNQPLALPKKVEPPFVGLGSM